MTMPALHKDHYPWSPHDWGIYGMVKENISTLDAALQYGIPVNKKGMCRCPFHNDKNPSMKVDKRFHCFGCQADGDVISFTSRLFGITRTAAAYKLASDFNLRTDKQALKVIPIKHPPVSEDEKIEHSAAYYYRELCDYRNLLIQWQDTYAPETPDEECDPRFIEALQNLAFVEYELDILWSGDLTSKKAVIEDLRQQKKKEVTPMNDSVAVPVYYKDGSYARDHKELELFRSSHMENINCKRAIEEAIARDFDGMRLRKTVANGVLDKFGAERVALVLAATVQTKSWDGRFSQQNKDWAFSIRMPENRPDIDYDRRDAYTVGSHPAVLDGFINHARREMKERSKTSISSDLKQPVINTPKPGKKQTELER